MIPRSYSRGFESSPQFDFTNSNSVTATVPLAIDMETQEPTSKKYLPMTDIEIINNSTVGLIFYPNQDRTRTYRIPAGVIKTFDVKDIPAFSTGLIFTKSGTATANQIEVTIWKRGVTQDVMSQIQHKKLFSRGGFLG